MFDFINLDRGFALVFIALAATSVAAIITRLLMYWQVRSDWQMLAFAGMNVAQFATFALIALSNAAVKILDRAEVRVWIFVGWAAVLLTFNVAVLGYLWQVITVNRAKLKLLKKEKPQPEG